VHKLMDALWAYHTAFKTPSGISPYKVIYGYPCHLFVELKRRSWRAIRTLDYCLNAIGEKRKLSLNELEEIRRGAYDYTRL